ncbi:MAG: NAD+ synthase [Actinobacteria bacterium]|uniref:NAD(+) synthase (glutamine-hydrolyzing) n=1 Tax=freshwater metagenome TaxID=449393 RepID=A0A6J6MBI5_9ZZZZ|nr:NAD+ synthase [Actinomycetota bacterium]MSX25245.1 NAD+ synthase [Actinomycetota bacterium]MSY46930.1 NAD+ synthase [Actinomycetota bacterium]MSY57624.1 NAD+ synthase [Actinomycetota bacterium]MTB00827.1 NAD+ synthase [Actinomycetota bacterium]
MGSQLRVALAQVNPTVGALKLNSDLIVERSLAAYASQAHLVVFPEMVVTGYPVEDLALRASFRSASKSMVADIARRIADGGAGELTVFLGYLDEVAGSTNRLGQPHGAPQNALAVIHQGEIKASYAKHHLPNYGVFDEFRNFVPGDSSLVVRIHGIDVGVAICEDIWQEGGTVAALVNRKPGLVIVPNGSPYERNKDDLRLALVQKRAKQIGAPLAYVNMTGGQDDLVFDGDTIVVDGAGNLLARAEQFNDQLLIVNLDLDAVTSTPDVVISQDRIEALPPTESTIAPRLEDEAEIWQALVVGLRDYVLKNGFAKVALGVSGGIDSALVAAIATDALGAKNVLGIALPSKYSSDHSLSDAQALAKNLGIEFRTVRIEEMVESFIVNLTLNGLAEENVQARVRGTTLMGISNQEGHLILATGNKSELAVGYSTLYGDAVGGFAPIKDIYKTDVWALARWRNTQGSVVIPVNSIDKEPSAELRPGQKDSDSLPEYSLLDQILLRYVDGDASSADLVAAGFDAGLVARVISLVDKAEYKRRQYPPGTKVSSRAFGKDRRLPITSSWRE